MNKIIVKTFPLVPKKIIHIFAKKYIAGDDLSDAVRVTKEIEFNGGMTTIDVLGEFVTTKENALHEANMCVKVLQAIKEFKLPSYLSIKPTSLGLGIDSDFAYNNIKSIVQLANSNGLFVRLDMENSPFTTKTLDIYKRLRKEGFDNVGIVIQAYMRRSKDDILSMIDYKPNIRLCKGIYIEDKKIAFKDPDEIRNNFIKLLELMIQNNIYPGIATHDESLINHSYNLIKQYKLEKQQYEFQMLLGVREEKRKSIIADGHRMRVYVPFGKDWYGYSTRRLKENPDIAKMIFKAIFFKN